MNSIDHSKKLLEAMAAELAQNIDDEIIGYTMDEEYITERNWTKVNMLATAESAAWIHINASGDYKYHNKGWYFEKAEDATAFLLKFT